MKNFKLILKSLINNEACVEGGRHRPWWIALIMFFLSMILSILPVFTQNVNKRGSGFVSSTYSFEVGVQRFTEDASRFSNLKITVESLEGSPNYLEVANWDETFTTVDELTNLHKYQHYNADSILDFECFYVEHIENDILTKIMNNLKVEPKEGETEPKYTNRVTSVLIFAKNEFIAYSYNMAGGQVGSVIGDYRNLPAGYNIKAFANITIDGVEYTIDKIKLPENRHLASKYYNAVWDNWKTFFDKGFEYNKTQLTWRTTLLMFGINAILVIFMGFMVWVLTRGKTNPFRVYTFWECELISAWASLAPAILALALGFLISQLSQIIFPLLLGLRVMWLSMKTLRPEYVAAPQTQKPVKTVNAKQIKK